MKQYQYDYTYIIRYKYYDEAESRLGYYCCNGYDTEPSLEELFEYFYLEEGDSADIEYQIANDFNSDEYLSDIVIHSLNDKNLNKELLDAHIAYIGVISSELYGDERTEYAKNIVNSILKYLESRNKNIYIIFEILKLLGLKFDENRAVITQLRTYLDANYQDSILLKLAPSHKVGQLKYYLEKMDKCYNIRNEQSKSRIGVLILRFAQQTELLYPKIKGNLKRLLEDVCEYYGIDAPTSRMNVLIKSKDPNTGKNIYKTIRDEHMKFWDNLP